MNRRGFLARCLAGAVLGLARNLPVPDCVTAPVEELVVTGLPEASFGSFHDGDIDVDDDAPPTNATPEQAALIRQMVAMLDKVPPLTGRATFRLHPSLHAYKDEIQALLDSL